MVTNNSSNIPSVNGGIVIGNGTGFSVPTLTNGQLLIGNTGTVPSEATLSVINGFNVTNGAGSITLSNLRNVSTYVVAKSASLGQYTTIQSAINQAVSDGASEVAPAAIWIQQGTYTENLVLADYVGLNSGLGAVNVVGAATYSGSNFVFVANLQFTGSGGDAFSNTGTGSIEFHACTFVSSASNYCISNVSSGNIVCFACKTVSAASSGSAFHLTGGAVEFIASKCINSGTVSLIDGGSTLLFTNGENLGAGFNISNGSVGLFACMIALQTAFTGSFITFTTNDCTAEIFNSSIQSQAASTYAITGASTLVYADMALTGTANLIDPAVTIFGTPSYSGSVSVGKVSLTGATSGTISILPQAAAGTFNFNLPSDAGTSGYLLTSAGGGSSPMTWTDPASMGTSLNAQTFNSNTTYTPTAGMSFCIVTICGGGGSGGNASNPGDSVGGGGGGAGTVQMLFNAAQIGASQSIVIGAGGTSGGSGGNSTFGSYITASGGAGGQNHATISSGGSGGGVSSNTGILLISSAGQGGSFGSSAGLTGALAGGSGGSCFMGGGANSSAIVGTNYTQNGNNASGPGGGGSGALCSSASSSATGGSGAGGYCTILEFIS